jgi:hypothetical protein
MDFAFLVLRLDSLEAQYSAALRRVVRFNQQLGYRVFRREHEGFVRARVAAERYFKCAAPFRKAAALYGGGAELSAVDPWLARRLEQQAESRPEDFALTLVSR